MSEAVFPPAKALDKIRLDVYDNYACIVSPSKADIAQR